MTGDLVLYHYWDSVCSYKVRMCLEEKGLMWTGAHVDLLKFEHLRPDYLALNPNGVVPTLMHDGKVVQESSVINEYLDKVFPETTLVPRDAYWRARMRIWVKYEDDVIHPSVRPGTFNLMIKSVVSRMSDRDLAAFVAAHPKPDVAADWVKAAREPVDRAAVAKAPRSSPTHWAGWRRRCRNPSGWPAKFFRWPTSPWRQWSSACRFCRSPAFGTNCRMCVVGSMRCPRGHPMSRLRRSSG